MAPPRWRLPRPARRPRGALGPASSPASLFSFLLSLPVRRFSFAAPLVGSLVERLARRVRRSPASRPALASKLRASPAFRPRSRPPRPSFQAPSRVPRSRTRPRRSPRPSSSPSPSLPVRARLSSLVRFPRARFPGRVPCPSGSSSLPAGEAPPRSVGSPASSPVPPSSSFSASSSSSSLPSHVLPPRFLLFSVFFLFDSLVSLDAVFLFFRPLGAHGGASPGSRGAFFSDVRLAGSVLGTFPFPRPWRPPGPVPRRVGAGARWPGPRRPVLLLFLVFFFRGFFFRFIFLFDSLRPRSFGGVDHRLAGPSRPSVPRRACGSGPLRVHLLDRRLAVGAGQAP